MIAPEIKKKAEAWMQAPYDEATRKAVADLMAKEDDLTEAFYKDLEFGTGGLRGILGVGTNRMNSYTVGMATQGFANYLSAACGKEGWEKRVAVAYDVRHGSAQFALETAKIFAANGFEVYIFTGMRPTPLLSFAVRYKHCCGGVMVTASHNPKEYNGYKAYGADGGQLVCPHDKAVIEEVRKITSYDLVKREGGAGLIHYVDAEIEEAYMQALEALRSPQVSAQARRDVKIVYTPLHGTGMTMVPKALRAWGFEQVCAVPEQMWPDGDFPYAASPNPEEKPAMSAGMALAATLKADIVMATDPDADRIGIGVPDGQGGYRLLNGNQTAALVTDYLLRRAADKPNRYVVKTIVTTEMLKDMAEAQGARCYDVLTGFKYIAEVLAEQEGKAFFVGGGEESYGYLAADFVRDKDAVMTACVIAEMVAAAVAEGKSVMQLLEDTYRRYGLYVQALVSLTKKGRSGSEEIQRMMAEYRTNPPAQIGGETVCEVRDYAKGFQGLPPADVLQFFTEQGGKVTVRPSGTEPKIKFYFEVKAPWREGRPLVEQEAALNARIDALKAALQL